MKQILFINASRFISSPLNVLIQYKGKGGSTLADRCCPPLVWSCPSICLFLYSWLGGLYLGLGTLHLRLGSFCPMVGNVVQVMSDVVAAATFGEFCYDARGMGHSVTIFTTGNHFVFILMTGYTAEITMLGLVGS